MRPNIILVSHLALLHAEQTNQKEFQMIRYCCFFLIIFALGLSACENASNSNHNFIHEISDLSADDRIEYGVLPNGLRYAVMANATPSNTATLLMRIDTGSINEKDDELGIAHFLEHMAFNGSENIPEGEMIKRLEKFGLAFGPDTNASTGFTETSYQLELPEVNDEIVNETLMLMRETAEKLTLDADAIDRERGVILAEKRARSSPAYNASIASLAYYLDGTPYPNRLPIGEVETIEAVTAEQFRDYYHGYYRPEDTFIVFVGDFETDYAAGKIAEYFSDWENKTDARAKADIPALGSKGKDAEYYVDPEIRTSISINVTSEPDLREDNQANRRDFFVESLGNRILSRRLARIAQTTDSPFISAFAGGSNFYDVLSISSLSMSTQPEKWDEALAVGEQELRKALLYGFTQAELDEQLANQRSSLEVAVQSQATRRTPNLARQIMGNFSNDSVMTDPDFNLEFFDSYTANITPEAVHEDFKEKWAGLENAQIYLSTSEVIENAEAQILSAFDNSQTIEVKPDIETVLGDFSYTDFGTSGNVASRDTVEDIGFETVRFENNVRLNIKKTPYEEDIIHVRVAYGPGQLSIPKDQLGLSWFATNILTLGGLEAHSADDIQTLMAGKTVSAGFDMGTKRTFIRGATTPKDLSDQLNLMAAYATSPGFRPEAQARYGKFIESYYPTLDSTPGGVASRDIDRLIRSGDERFGIPSEEKLLSVTLEDMQNWFKPLAQDSAIEIGIVGDVDIDAIIAEVARTFGALPKRQSLPKDPDPSLTKLMFPEGSKRPVTLPHSGEPTTGLLRIYWPAPDGTDVKTAREIEMIKAMLRIRLTEVLREEEGATYSPGTFSFQPRTYPGYGYIAMSLEVAPEEISQVAAKLLPIAAEFRAGEFDADLLKRARQPILERIENSLENNNYWLGLIDEAQSDPVPLERHRSRQSMYEDMTVDSLKARAATLFDPATSVTFHILPEK